MSIIEISKEGLVALFKSMPCLVLSVVDKALCEAVEAEVKKFLDELPNKFREWRFETVEELIRKKSCSFHLFERGNLAKKNILKKSMKEIDPVLKVWGKFGVTFVDAYEHEGQVYAILVLGHPIVERVVRDK
ncbi:MAG: hypothetical protein OQK82_03970 [Candidatus Pacearchaeota archaeon]|nr:hypothetical protein [Candidatus Pacearchaeota archaeon]